MSFNFPNSPTLNQIYSPGGISYQWNGTVWRTVGSDFLYIGDPASTTAKLMVEHGVKDASAIEMVSNDNSDYYSPRMSFTRQVRSTAHPFQLSEIDAWAKNDAGNWINPIYMLMQTLGTTPGSEGGEMWIGVLNNGVYSDLLDLFGTYVSLPSGSLLFPTTQKPSTAATAFDDYEEGLWTPTFGVASGAFTTLTYDSAANQWGSYVKLGRFVMAVFRIRTTAVTLGTASGQLRINGLPYTSGTIYSFPGTMNMQAYSATWVTAHPTGGLVAASASYMLLYSKAGITSDSAALTAANMTLGAGNDIIGTIVYQTTT